jgi:hypothetical protein
VTIRTADVLAEPDRPVSTAEVLEDVGPQFRNVLYQMVVREVGRSRDLARVSYRRGGRDVTRFVRAYSRHRTCRALLERVSLPGRSGARRVHDRETVTTAEIAASLRVTGKGNVWTNHAVPVCGALEYPEQDLPIAPYTLGAWLGDGTTGDAQFTCADDEILEQIRSDASPRRWLLGGLPRGCRPVPAEP